MIIVFWIMMAIGLSGIAWSSFMLFRNKWVFKARTEILKRGFEAYETLPSYEFMLSRWWIWDVEKFMNKEVK